MGSFTEGVLSFDFREDTPDEVLAGFSALVVPLPDDAYWAPAPPLPAPIQEDPMDWEPVHLAWQPDAPAPWGHDWGHWLGISMSVQTTPHAILVWSQRGRWNLDCRFSLKEVPDTVHRALAWMAPFIHPTVAPGYPQLVGHLLFEGGRRPFLLWCKDGTLEMENLNPEEWFD